jgi:hypothetical protein
MVAIALKVTLVLETLTDMVQFTLVALVVGMVVAQLALVLVLALDFNLIYLNYKIKI